MTMTKANKHIGTRVTPIQWEKIHGLFKKQGMTTSEGLRRIFKKLNDKELKRLIMA